METFIKFGIKQVAQLEQEILVLYGRLQLAMAILFVCTIRKAIDGLSVNLLVAVAETIYLLEYLQAPTLLELGTLINLRLQTSPII